LEWFSIPQTSKGVLFWYGRSTGIRFGDSNFNEAGVPQSYTFEKYLPAIYDTGTSMTMIP
jgi:hypothetical protein